MPSHMSNSDRIARLAAEAAATAAEKAAKKAAPKAKRVSKPRAPKAPVRMKIVWCVGDPNAANPKIFAYPDRAAADAEAAKNGKGLPVKALKVPME
jgi:hypothetical protein